MQALKQGSSWIGFYSFVGAGLTMFALKWIFIGLTLALGAAAGLALTINAVVITGFVGVTHARHLRHEWQSLKNTMK
jgi:uncharacterized membrane-anchored protein YitT (DUF2179 family)